MAHVAPRVSALGQTVYYHFYKWRRDGRLRRAHDRLREALRKAEGRERNPSGAMIDSQSVKATGVGGEERGIEQGRSGSRAASATTCWWTPAGSRARRAGLHAASLHDRDGAQVLLSDELEEELPRLGISVVGGRRLHARVSRVG
jgi:putative transposase